MNPTTGHPTRNDVQWIIQSMERNLVSPFQSLSVKQLYEIAPWSLITKLGEENKAYAAFLDYPYEGHYSTTWYTLIKSNWGKSVYCGEKTLFLHFLVCESDVKTFLSEILKRSFLLLPSLEWCCIVTHRSIPMDIGLQELFLEDESMETEEFQFWATERNSYISKIGIRCKQYEDYLAVKSMFSQMYDSLKNDSLKKLTLDFLDYGEDRCPTYKYFTFDDDNTYIGIADNEDGEAIGLIYATIRRIDLDLLNDYFQLECVYGLRKKHPADNVELSFDTNGASSSEESIDEENEVRELVSNLIDEVEFDYEIRTCLNDILEETCDPSKKYRRRRLREKQPISDKELMNSNDFKLSNPSHLALLTKKNIKNLTQEALVRIINSQEFDVNNETHMQLVPRLGKAIEKSIREDRIKEILNSKIFDPSTTDYAMVSLHVMSHVPEHKLQLFKKSSIGSQLYKKLMYQKALAKKAEIGKTKKNKVPPKLSFKDTQIILHYTEDVNRIKPKTERKAPNEREVLPDQLKHIHYRNMGFISGLTLRGKYRFQGCSSIPKMKEPFCFEKRQEQDKLDTETASEVEAYKKYPRLDVEEAAIIQEIPYYNGGSNCFYVEQFAIEEDYEYQSLYLIMAAFEYFPRVDYSILLLPYGSKQVPYLRSHFSTIPARPFSSYEKELFVFHKAAFNRLYDIRMYTEDDLKGIKHLIASSCLKDHILSDVECSLINKEMQTIVLLSESQVFGVAIVKKMKEVETVRRNYDITERVDMKYHKYTHNGQLLHCVIHPIFKYVSNMFLKEIMRLCQKSILYYKVYPTHLLPYDPSLWQSLCNVLEHLSPLRPIKKTRQKVKSFIVFNTGSEDENTKIKNGENKNYCLCYTCINMALKGNIIVTSRIVVVGESSIALGVLESLIYRNDYKYTNVTIISKCGIPGECKLDEKCHLFSPTDLEYTESLLNGLCLSAWVTIIKAEVISIKRNLLKLRELSSNKPKSFFVGFDYLILCTDLEFQTLHVKKSTNDKSRTSKDMQYSLLSGLRQQSFKIAQTASNVFCVNNAYEAADLLNWLWRYFLRKVESRAQPKKKYKNLAEMERDKKDGRIVIYGNHIATYTTLAVLRNEEFPLSKLTFIKGSSSQIKFTFPTKFIEEAVDYILTKSGLELIDNAMIDYDKESEEVTSIDVTTDDGTTRIDCSVLLLTDEKSVNYKAFKTLHRSSLSFTLPVRDSKGHPYLLINSNFQTNATHIFAAGTLTEMHITSGEYVRFEDCKYNEREVGLLVGENVSKAVTSNLQSTNSDFPIFSNPEVTYAKLPHDFNYIFIISADSHFLRKSKTNNVEYRVESLIFGNLNTGAYIVPAPMTEEEKMLDEFLDSEEQIDYQEFLEEVREFEQIEREQSVKEEVIIERILPDEPEYFALTFDENENVHAIECLTKKDINVLILKKLHGVHVTELFKTFQKVGEERNKLSFYLAENWILELDHVLFEEQEIKPRKRGYEGYWRPGYPKYIEKRLDEFLDSFATYKESKNK